MSNTWAFLGQTAVLVAGVIVILLHNNSRFASVEKRIDGLELSFNKRIDDLRSDIEHRIADLKDHLLDRIERLEHPVLPR